MDFESVLEKCGNFGRFQIVILLLYGYTNILGSLHYFCQSLITFTPEHWCYHEQLEGLNASALRLVYANQLEPSCTPLNSIENGSVVQPCQRWIYDREHGFESITTELNWVCENAYKPAVGQSFFFMGSVLGTITFGYLSDYIGRLPAMLMTALIGATGDFVTSFVHSLPWFAFTRFIAGLSTDTMYYLMYIIVFEYLSAKHRTFGLNIILAIFYCFGLMISPWAALWIGHWRSYLWLASLPALGILMYPVFICESAQWLLTKQRYDCAVKCLKRVANFNGRQVDDSVFDAFVKHYKEKVSEELKLTAKEDTFLGMLRLPRQRRFLLTLFIKSIIITLAYDVVSRNMEGLGTSPFKLFSLTAVVYLPAGCTILLLQNRIGRKGMACLSLFAGGLITTLTGSLIAFLDPQQHALLLAVMIALGRFGVTVSYDAEVQYAAEIIPTSVRGRAVSNVHVVGLASSSLTFYVIYLARFYKPLPSIFIGCLMLIGAALCLTLPETLNRKLPDTLAEGECFALDEHWSYFPCCQKRRSKSSSKNCDTRV